MRPRSRLNGPLYHLRALTRAVQGWWCGCRATIDELWARNVWTEDPNPDPSPIVRPQPARSRIIHWDPAHPIVCPDGDVAEFYTPLEPNEEWGDNQDAGNARRADAYLSAIGWTDTVRV